MGIEDPRKIRETEASTAHGSGHAEAGSGNLGIVALGEAAENDLLQAAAFLGREALVANVKQWAVLESVQCEVNFGAAHIPGENHRAISSFPIPFASAGGKWAAAALSSKNSSLP